METNFKLRNTLLIRMKFYFVILMLLFLYGCKNETSDWKKVKTSLSAKNVKEFLQKYPNSEYDSIAKIILDSLMLVDKIKIYDDNLIKSNDKNQALKDIEEFLSKTLKKRGISGRFFIHIPYLLSKNSPPSSFVMSPYEKNGYVTYDATEYPWDRNVYGMAGASGLGNLSILRFNGDVPFKVGEYKAIVGEGEKFYRLTFILLDENLIYMRGKGKVKKNNGDEIKLGY